MSKFPSLFSLNNKSWSNIEGWDNVVGSRRSNILAQKQTIDTSSNLKIPRQKPTKAAMSTPRVQYNKVFEMVKHLEKPLFVIKNIFDLPETKNKSP